MRSLFVALLIPGLSFAGVNVPIPEPKTQNQTQVQNQGQSQEQSAQSGASLELNYKERLQIPFTPAPTAPAIYASNPCALGESKATTIPVFGRSTGKTTVDPGCEFRELVRVTASVDPCLARKLLATHPAIALLQQGEIVCSVPTGTVTKADLDRVEQESKARDDAVFRQSVKK